MSDRGKSGEQLSKELEKLRNRVSQLENIAAEREQVIQDLQESEIIYETLVNNSNDAIYLLFENRFETISPKFTEVFGVTAMRPKRMISTSWTWLRPKAVP